MSLQDDAQHPPYSLDLSPYDFHIFGELKKDIYGHCFALDEDVRLGKKLVRYTVHRFFRNRIDQLVSQWDKCINSAGDSFWGNKCYMVSDPFSFDCTSYLVSSEFSSKPIFLFAFMNISVLSQTVCTFSPNILISSAWTISWRYSFNSKSILFYWIF